MPSHITQEQIREVLAKAEAIQERMNADGAQGVAVEEVLAAAQEAGLSREAVELAMIEHNDLFVPAAQVGDLAFAPSMDGCRYVAEVLLVNRELATVRFMKGGERTVPASQARVCTFLPGERLSCNWPGWGWWGSTVLAYDEDNRKVRVSDGWGSDSWFDLTDVRLERPKEQKSGGLFGRRLPTHPRPWARFWWSLTLLASGGVIGMMIQQMASR